MAFAAIPFWTRPANLLPEDLTIARAAYVERVDAEMLKAQRACSMGGMSNRLIEAGCFLAIAGVDASPCAGEHFFG